MNDLRALIRFILENPPAAGWSVQGFGMLRLYLGSDRVYRLHIWDDRLRVPEVTTIHDHPWDLESQVICGAIENTRFAVVDPSGVYPRFRQQKILCGENAHTISEPILVGLRSQSGERILPGQSYSQFRDEVHSTAYARGTVTLVRRTFHADRDHARVFYPAGERWVDAAPREATVDEIQLGTKAALETMNRSD